MSPELRLELNSELPPPKQNSVEFVCSQCGECCGGWNLPIEAEKAEYLLTRPWVKDRLAQFERAFERLSRNTYILPQTAERICVFLGEDGRCQIHAKEGPEWKPNECKRFPFATVLLPNGTLGFDTSTVCKTISEDLLHQALPIVPNVTKSTLQLTTEAHHQPAYPSFPVAIPLIKHWWRNGLPWPSTLTLPYETYTDTLKTLQQACLDPSISPEALLKQAQKRWFKSETPLKLPQNQPFLWWWFSRKPYGVLSHMQQLMQWGKQWGLYYDPKIFGRGVGIPSVLNAAFDQQNIPPECNTLLKGFLWQLLSRKMPLTQGQTLSSLLSQACVALVLVRWYSQAMAWLQEDTTVSTSEISLAIRLLDRYYTGHQPHFPEAFRWWPAIANCHQWML